MDKYQITFQTWNKIATIYQDRFMYLDVYNDTYDMFCSLVTKSEARILEIGCGPGNITRYLLDKRPDFKIIATDIAPAMVALAKNNNPVVECEVMDCRDIAQLSDKFDAIVCGFCMPYLAKEDCVNLIKDCADLLNNDGIFYFSLIESNYENSGWETNSTGENKMFVYYYQEDFLLKQLKENGLEVAESMRKTFTKSDGTESTHLIFIARKKGVN